jgi:hypothetical protein
MIRGDERRGGVLEFGEAVVRRVELEHLMYVASSVCRVG